MYIKINNKDEFEKVKELFHANGFSLNNNLRQNELFVPLFVFAIRDEKPLVSPKQRTLIWAGTPESVGSNYWDVKKDWNNHIVPFATDKSV
jgi:hypothetical protein